MIFLLLLFMYAPEDSNCQYLLDKQIAHYFPSWEAQFDSFPGGMRTSQGCLDLLNWYIDFDIKYEVELSRVLGLRYRYKFLGDYGIYINDHRFDPFFRLKHNLRFFFTITTHYYKGEDELGLGFFMGNDYLNYLELAIVAEDFDRNFSLKDVPEGPERIVYQQHPIKLLLHFNSNWKNGHLTCRGDVSNRYRLGSTEIVEIGPPFFRETGLHRFLYTRFWQDIGRWRIGGILDIKESESYQQDQSTALDRVMLEAIIEPMLGCRLTDKWRTYLYLTGNRKTVTDSTHYFSIPGDSIVSYERTIGAYLIDVEFHPGGRFIWHFGMQRQFYWNNQESEFTDRRLNLGFEYRWKNMRFYFVEAMEGDFPTPKWLHNHTYVQLMIIF